jgi:allophanate hydrolase
MIRDAANGGAIDLEVWKMSKEAFGSFVASVSPPLAIGNVELESGEAVKVSFCWFVFGVCVFDF